MFLDLLKIVIFLIRIKNGGRMLKFKTQGGYKERGLYDCRYGILIQNKEQPGRAKRIHFAVKFQVCGTFENICRIQSIHGISRNHGIQVFLFLYFY